jgi:uncharacterized protein
MDTNVAVAARANVITLGSRDHRRLREFYVGLGWTPVIDEEDDICVFPLRGALLSLYPLPKLAVDGHVEAAGADARIRSTIGINVDRREDVDAMIARVREAGGRITKAPEDSELFDGRSAYFADPEDHFWEIVWLAPGSSVQSLIDAANGVSR